LIVLSDGALAACVVRVSLGHCAPTCVGASASVNMIAKYRITPPLISQITVTKL
jgi:hypothetical protein